MKKKAIEAVPYLTLPKVKYTKAQYVAVTADEDIAGEKHLFIEVYRNRRQDRETPVVRIVMNHREYGNYFPSGGRWSRENIKSDLWRGADLLWEKGTMQGIPVWARNVLHSAADLQRISSFMDGMTVESREWYEGISQWQRAVLREERSRQQKRRYERRQAALQATPELDEQSVREYADRVLFGEQHYLYYKKHGARVTIACSACGGVSESKWKVGVSYESLFERTIEEPDADAAGECPLCGAHGTYKALGRAKGTHYRESGFYIGEKYGGQGMVFRYVVAEKKWGLAKEDGTATGAWERIYASEVARTYFEPGKKPQTDWYKYSNYTGQGFWDDCNMGGLHNMRMKPAWIHPDTYANMRGTFLQYSALEEYARTEGELNPVEYMESYIITPQMEMLVKMGLTDIVSELTKYHYGIVMDDRADRIDAFLGIRSEHVRLLQREKGNLKLLHLLQQEKRNDWKWTDEQAQKLAELDLHSGDVDVLLRYMSTVRMLNRVSKYAGCGYGAGYGAAQERLHQTAQLYADYLSMCEKLHYDMTDSIRLHPHDLIAEHDKMVLQADKAAEDERIKKVLKDFPLIKKHYSRLYRRYHYERDGYSIRPARDAGEIVMEGRKLHHCVGGDNYLGRHNRGESYILFLRSSKEPDTPYITVEITPKMEIRQWYGAYDKKPDEENMQAWLDRYAATLKGYIDNDAADNAGRETLMPAAI